MDFKTFSNNYTPPKNEPKPSAEQTTQDYEQTINKYKDLSQQELMTELLRQTQAMKSQGRWDEQNMQKMTDTLMPYLNNEQKNMLHNIYYCLAQIIFCLKCPLC